MPKLTAPLSTPIAGDQIVTTDVWQRYFTNLHTEGIWTPVLGGETLTAGQIYAVQVGTFVKLGRLVIATGRVQLVNKGTITGNVWMAGLPFVSATIPSHQWPAVIGLWRLANQTSSLVGSLASHATGVSLHIVQGGKDTETVPLAPNDIADNTMMSLTISYLAEA
jgi:hypothetical protein